MKNYRGFVFSLLNKIMNENFMTEEYKTLNVICENTLFDKTKGILMNIFLLILLIL